AAGHGLEPAVAAARPKVLLQGDLRAEGEGIEVLADLAVADDAVPETHRNRSDAADRDVLPLQGEFQGAVRIPVDRRREDALVAAAYPARRNGMAERAGIVVEVEVAVTRRDFPCAGLPSVDRERAARLRVGECAVLGIVGPALAGDRPARLGIPAVEIERRCARGALVEAVAEITGLGIDAAPLDGTLEAVVPGAAGIDRTGGNQFQTVVVDGYFRCILQGDVLRRSGAGRGIAAMEDIGAGEGCQNLPVRIGVEDVADAHDHRLLLVEEQRRVCDLAAGVGERTEEPVAGTGRVFEVGAPGIGADADRPWRESGIFDIGLLDAALQLVAARGAAAE